MSKKSYAEIYDKMSNKQKDAMANLYMSGINNDGHTWVTYGDVEEAVAIIVKDFLENKDDRNIRQNNL